MIAYALISPTGLRDYAKSRGWKMLPEAAKDRLYVMNSPNHIQRQLVFPMDAAAPDYPEAVALVLEKLAVLERREPEAVLQSVLEVGEDAIAFSVASSRFEEGFLPLSFASSMVAGAQQILLSSACTVLKPQMRPPRLNCAEAQLFLEATRFRHTQPGSFILNVSCPVNAMDAQPMRASEGHDVPFVRQAMLTLNRSLKRLVSAIETDSLDDLVKKTKESAQPEISSNFCEALTHFGEESLKNSLDIKIAWAAAIARPAGEPDVSIVRIQHDYFPRIEEVRRELRSSASHVDDTFIGTVERLDGEMGPDGRRSGEVVLSVLLPEGEQVRVRTALDADQYKNADLAHMTEGTYVKLTGRLYPGRQPRHLSNLTAFELIKS